MSVRLCLVVCTQLLGGCIATCDYYPVEIEVRNGATNAPIENERIVVRYYSFWVFNPPDDAPIPWGETDSNGVARG